VEVNDQGAQSDEIAVAFNLEFEILFDGPADGLGLNATDLGGLGNGEPNGIFGVSFGFRAVDNFFHRSEKRGLFR
jgi:hypothetical protein